jgi:hypothetical protein
MAGGTEVTLAGPRSPRIVELRRIGFPEIGRRASFDGSEPKLRLEPIAERPASGCEHLKLKLKLTLQAGILADPHWQMADSVWAYDERR